MDRTNLSEAILHDCGAVFTEELHTVAPVAAAGDVAAIEHCFQQAMRVVGGTFLTHVLGERASEVPRPEACPTCGKGVRLIDAARARSLQTLVGDACMRRPVYVCTRCHEGYAPLDTAMGVGSMRLSPGLARVACRLGIEEAFETAADVRQETRGVHLLPEAVRRVSEAVGAVAEAAHQERSTRLRHGALVEPAGGVETLVVAVDGVLAHLDDAWHEMKVGRAAPLGPDLQTDPRSGRVLLRLGDSHCGAGLEEAEGAWYRFYLLALDAGLGRATTRMHRGPGRRGPLDLDARCSVPGRTASRDHRDGGHLSRVRTPLERGVRRLCGHCGLLGRALEGRPLRPRGDRCERGTRSAPLPHARRGGDRAHRARLF